MHSTHGGGDGEEDWAGGAGVTGDEGAEAAKCGETDSADDDASDSSADTASISFASGACVHVMPRSHNAHVAPPPCCARPAAAR